MASRVARRRTRGKRARVSRERRRVRQHAVRARIGPEIARVVKTAVEGALQAEVTALLGRERYQRRAQAPHGRAGVRCARCGQDWRRRLWRAGSYRRTLLTVVAAVLIRMPRVGCRCGGTVRLEFETVAPYARCWGDMQERARQLAGLCLSLRDAREVLALGNGQEVARSTLNGWVHQAAELAQALRVGELARVPPVVLLDGVWVKLMVPTGAWYTDRQGRRRERVRRVRVPLLVAYGVDPTSGERWVLDWERAAGEDEASWRTLLERLLARGLRADTGLEVFLHDGSGGLEAAFGLVDFGPEVLRQRCVFHVLRNLADAVQGEPGLSREQKRARRTEVVQAAAAIWQATERAEVQRRRRAFVDRWQEREPGVVATLERVFPTTLAYLEALERARERGEVWQPRYLRATSLLERANRGFRQKAHQVGVFHSETGLQAAIALVITHRGLGLWAAEHSLWTDALETLLLAA